jgi:hypothetical protein
MDTLTPDWIKLLLLVLVPGALTEAVKRTVAACSPGWWKVGGRRALLIWLPMVLGAGLGALALVLPWLSPWGIPAQVMPLVGVVAGGSAGQLYEVLEQHLLGRVTTWLDGRR